MAGFDASEPLPSFQGVVTSFESSLTELLRSVTNGLECNTFRSHRAMDDATGALRAGAPILRKSLAKFGLLVKQQTDGPPIASICEEVLGLLAAAFNALVALAALAGDEAAPRLVKGALQSGAQLMKQSSAAARAAAAGDAGLVNVSIGKAWEHCDALAKVDTENRAAIRKGFQRWNKLSQDVVREFTEVLERPAREEDEGAADAAEGGDGDGDGDADGAEDDFFGMGEDAYTEAEKPVARRLLSVFKLARITNRSALDAMDPVMDAQPDSAAAVRWLHAVLGAAAAMNGAADEASMLLYPPLSPGEIARAARAIAAEMKDCCAAVLAAPPAPARAEGIAEEAGGEVPEVAARTLRAVLEKLAPLLPCEDAAAPGAEATG